MAEKTRRLEKHFAAAGRSLDDRLTVRDLIEYDNQHHGSPSVEAQQDKRRAITGEPKAGEPAASGEAKPRRSRSRKASAEA
jgi:hypothetical protein